MCRYGVIVTPMVMVGHDGVDVSVDNDLGDGQLQ